MSDLTLWYGTGASVFLGCTLLAGGIAKAVSIRSFGLTLASLVPSRAWRAPGLTAARVARLVVGLELGLGLTLLLAGGATAVVVSYIMGGLCAAFLVSVLAAMRKGISCGCFGRLASSPAGPAEVARTSALLAIAVSLALLRQANQPPTAHASGAGIGIAGLLALAVIGLTELAGRFPRPADRGGERREPLLARIAAALGAVPRPGPDTAACGCPIAGGARGGRRPGAGRPVARDRPRFAERDRSARFGGSSGRRIRRAPPFDDRLDSSRMGVCAGCAGRDEGWGRGEVRGRRGACGAGLVARLVARPRCGSHCPRPAPRRFAHRRSRSGRADRGSHGSRCGAGSRAAPRSIARDRRGDRAARLRRQGGAVAGPSALLCGACRPPPSGGRRADPALCRAAHVESARQPGR